MGNHTHGSISICNDLCQNPAVFAVLLSNLLATKNKSRSSVTECRGVCSRDCASTVSHESRLQCRYLLQLELVVRLVFRNNSLALSRLDSNRRNFIFEEAGLPRLLCALIGQNRKFVLFLSCHVILLGCVLRAVAHVDLVVYIP